MCVVHVFFLDVKKNIETNAHVGLHTREGKIESRKYEHNSKGKLVSVTYISWRFIKFKDYVRWLQIMKNLLGTHMGHFALCIMCSMIRDEKSARRDIGLIRGVVFALSMALWNDKSLLNLQYSPTSVLPYFVQVCNKIIIIDQYLRIFLLPRTFYNTNTNLLIFDK